MYSRMHRSWSRVGGSSVTSREKGERPKRVFAVALADASLNAVRTRMDAGEVGLWKMVTMSRPGRCEGGEDLERVLFLKQILDNNIGQVKGWTESCSPGTLFSCAELTELSVGNGMTMLSNIKRWLVSRIHSYTP